MARILANDGLEKEGVERLTQAGHEVSLQNFPQKDLPEALKNFDALVVRSATKVRKDLIDQCPHLKLVVRAGTGMDNIDVEYAQSNGIKALNTPGVSSQSVAELVFAHMFSMARFTYDANRRMPAEGADKFNELKKLYSEGTELRGKVLGIIGFGSIGQTVAKMGLGLGMHILPFKLHHESVKIEIDFFKIKDASVNIVVHCDPFDMILRESDYITLHVPFKEGDPPILYKERFALMKDGVKIINTSRGGVVVEDDLLHALNSGKVAAAALDVFEGEPVPRKEILEHPRISLTPHIGASTKEAQTRTAIAVADKIIQFFKK